MIRKRIMVLFLSVFLLGGISFSAFAQEDIREVQNSVVKFSGDLAKVLPFNSALGLNWSDAHIGKVTDGHFGAGISAGVTTMDISSINGLIDNFAGIDVSLSMSKLPIPAYTVEGRVGGFVLPFDIGIKFGILPSLGLFGINFDYLMVGGDFRYAIIDGISNPSLPNVSLGVGVNYLKGGIGAKANTSQTISFGSDSFQISDAAVDLKWDTTALDLKAQVSKTFAIVTPYLGLGGSYAFSNAGYAVDSKVTRNGQPINQDDIDRINGYLEQYDLEKIDIDADGISSIKKVNDFSFRAFGGLSLNLAAFRFDLTGLYSILDSNFGGSIGLRFQL